MRKLCWGFFWVCLFLLTGGVRCQAEEKAASLPMVPFHYTQDFEQGANPFVYWVTNPAKYTVNFMDITEEKAASGKKSFKLDITFPEACYSYWRIPVKIPVVGKNLNFQGKMLFLQGEKTKAGLGCEAIFPKSYLSGCMALTQFEPSETWQEISGNLGVTTQWAAGMNKLVWGLTPDCVGTYVNALGLFIYVGTATRVVIYVDDIDIAGEVPEEKAYANEVTRRWALYQEGPFKKAVAGFESRLSGITKNVEGASGLDEKTKAAVAEKTSPATTKLAEIQKKGWLSPDEYNALDKLLFDATEILQSVKNDELFK